MSFVGVEFNPTPFFTSALNLSYGLGGLKCLPDF